MGARPSSYKKDVEAAYQQGVRDAVGGTVDLPARDWSTAQLDIFRWFAGPDDTAPGLHGNLVVRARAGTGKTTTIIEGVNRAPEQSILLCAFNKRIAEELNGRITNPAAEAKTLHSVGYAAIRRQWRGIPVAKSFARGDQLTNAVVPADTPRQIRSLVSQLHTKGRDMLPLTPTVEALTTLMYQFDLTPDEGWQHKYPDAFVAEAAQKAMKLAATEQPTYDVGVDFADMIYLPLVWNLLAPDYELVVVDEAQDMTLAQLTIAQRICSGRICVVGDDRQAIYGFRGADSDSLNRLRKELRAEELPLVTTYRCGHKIVEVAQTLVPDIMAGPSNPAGALEAIHYDEMLKLVEPTDYVLSRLNAPLASATLNLLREGKRAKMAGRDIGASITAIVSKLRCSDYTSTEEFLEKLETWERKQSTRLAAAGQNQLLDKLRDQADTLRALSEDMDTISDLKRRLVTLFTDDQDAGHVLLASVHKAKGLETNRVFLFDESLYRRGVNQEEQNIEYVAVTRAKTHLFRVTGVPSLQRR